MKAIDPRMLRNAFGSFMTGVTVVTSCDAGGVPVGFTANSFSSVSLDPPLLLVCPGKFLSSFEAFANCSHFAVNILAEGQEDISNIFAGYRGDRFGLVPHGLDLHGVPVLDGVLAQFSCKTHQVYDAGDHAILIGEVRDFNHGQGRGLGYAGGQYFSLGLERAALENSSGSAASGSVVCGAIIEHGDHLLLEKTANGYRPAQIASYAPAGLRSELHDALAAQGVEAAIGPAYSVFNDAANSIQYSYFLAEAVEVSPHTSLQPVAKRELKSLPYTHKAIAHMIARFALEADTRTFGLYLGDTEQGDIHTLSTRI